jgi:autotransporter-associated beta strand protein
MVPIRVLCEGEVLMNRAMFSPLGRAIGAVVVALGLAAPQTLAQNYYYWDLNGPAAGSGASGTAAIWDTTTANWNTMDDGAGDTTTWVNDIYGSTAFFSAGSDATGAYSVIVSGAIQAEIIAFSNGAVTLYGQNSPSLSIGYGGIGTGSNDGPTTLDSSLGNVAVVGWQTWSNWGTQPFNVNCGVIANGASSLTLAGNCGSINGVLADGSGPLSIEVSSGSWVFGHANSFTGGTIVDSGGALRLQSAGAINAGTVAVAGSLSETALNALTGTAALAINMGGAVTLSQPNNYTGATSVSGSTLNLQCAGAISASTVSLGNSSWLNIAAPNAISSTATLILRGGTIVAAASGARISCDTTMMNSTTITGTNSLTIGGSFTNSAYFQYLFNGTTAPGGGLVLAGNVYLAPNNAASDTLALLSSSPIFSPTTISGNIANNSGANTKPSSLFVGPGFPVSLEGNNTYTGGTVVNGGYLFLGNVNALGGGQFDLVSGILEASIPGITLANASTLSGVIDGANSLTFSGTVSLASSSLLDNSITGAGNGLVLAGTVILGTGYLNGPGATTISGIITDAGNARGLSYRGNGALYVSGPANFSGPSTVTGGSLVLLSALPSASAVTVGNTTTSGQTPTLSGTGTINGPLTVLGPPAPGIPGSATPAGSAGHLAPGLGGVGTLTAASSVTLNDGCELDYNFAAPRGSGSHSSPDASSMLALISGASLILPAGGTVVLNDVSATPFTGNGSYELFSYASGVTVTNFVGTGGSFVAGPNADLGSITLGSGFAANEQYALVNDPAVGGIFLDFGPVTATPEPATIVLLALGGWAVLPRRGRSK